MVWRRKARRGRLCVSGSLSRRRSTSQSFIAAAAVAASASYAWGQATSLPTFANNVYNVTVANPSINGGVAASTGSSDNSTALNAYISYCSAHGGGTVQIPAGTFDSNTITMLSNVNLQLASGSVLYNATPANTLIQTSGSASNMEISGSGIINGAATTSTGNNKLVYLQNVTTLEITGVSIENAAQEHLGVENDSNVTINNITIADPGTLAANGNNYLSNTDGIDYSGSNFTIENSSINDGDDDIVAKTASTYCSNILITNDTIGAGHGISVGGGSAAGLKNMTVSNITFNGTTDGLRLKAQDASGDDAGGGTLHPVSNVLYSNIVMTNVEDPIVIDSFYDGGNNFPSSPTQTNKAVDSTTPMWENIGFSNISITGSSSGALIYDLDTTPQNLQGLSFSNVSLNSNSASKMWWGTNVNLSGLTANQSLGEQDLTNVTAPGAVSITWNNTGASVGGTVLADGATWDIVGNQNWNTGSSFTAYTNSSNVTFNDSNNGHYSVTLNTTVSPLSTTINNSLGAYTISGSGTIAGSGSLTKTGASTATISTSNAYTGGTIINGGTLTVGSVNALGGLETLGTGAGAKPGGTTVNTNGSLDLNGMSLSEPITLNGGTLTNSNAATASVIGGVKGVGYTTTKAGIAAGSTITFSSGTAAATPIFGITAASFSGFTGTYTTPTSTNNPPPQAPNVLITSSDGKGSGALAYADLTGNSLTGITVVYPGSGYDAAPIISFIGGNPSVAGSATGNANNFTIVGIQTTSTGSGYTSAPTATLNNNGGAGAVTLTTVIGSLTLQSTSSIGGNAGNISLGLPITGAGGLIKTGSDTLTLSAVNAYSGATTINAGALNVQNGGALADTSSATVASGAALQLQGGISTTTAVGLTLNGTGIATNGALENVAGNNTYSGLIALGSNSTIGSDAGTLTLSNTGAITGSGNNLTLTGSGNGTLASIIGTGAAAVTKSGSGTWTLTGANTYTGGTTVNAGTLVVGVNGALSDAGVSVTGGTLQLGAGTGQAQMTSLSITGNGALDVNNNHFILTYGASDPITTIAGYIASGYNGGAWNGPGGIISTAAQTSTNSLLYGVGYADGADGVVSNLTSGQIEVAYTLLGDANLDGLVNGSDFNILAANFNQSITGWDQGDFNYDGLVNASDFNELAANFNQGVSGAASAGDIAALDAFAAANGLSLPTSSVPEPASIALLALGAIGGLARRRRKSAGQ
jgi:autotransporter-associated beta strand protein